MYIQIVKFYKHNVYKMDKGAIIKNAIRGAGFSLEDAAGILNISRQTLYINLKKPDDDFIKRVAKDFKKFFNLFSLFDDAVLKEMEDENYWESGTGVIRKTDKDLLLDQLQERVEEQKITIVQLSKFNDNLERQLNECRDGVIKIANFKSGKTGGRHTSK